MRNLYLVAYYYQRPDNPRVRTQIPGWMKQEGNLSWDEQVQMTTRLRNRDHSMAKVILDLGKKTVVKNSWDSGKSFDELFEYYRKNYPKYTEELATKLYPDVAAQPTINT